MDTQALAPTDFLWGRERNLIEDSRPYRTVGNTARPTFSLLWLWGTLTLGSLFHPVYTGISHYIPLSANPQPVMSLDMGKPKCHTVISCTSAIGPAEETQMNTY